MSPRRSLTRPIGSARHARPAAPKTLGKEKRYAYETAPISATDPRRGAAAATVRAAMRVGRVEQHGSARCCEIGVWAAESEPGPTRQRFLGFDLERDYGAFEARPAVVRRVGAASRTRSARASRHVLYPVPNAGFYSAFKTKLWG